MCVTNLPWAIPKGHRCRGGLKDWNGWLLSTCLGWVIIWISVLKTNIFRFRFYLKFKKRSGVSWHLNLHDPLNHRNRKMKKTPNTYSSFLEKKSRQLALHLSPVICSLNQLPIGPKGKISHWDLLGVDSESHTRIGDRKSLGNPFNFKSHISQSKGFRKALASSTFLMLEKNWIYPIKYPLL